MSGYYEDMDSATLLRISFISLKLASVKSDQPGYPVETAIRGVETVTNSRKGRSGL